MTFKLIMISRKESIDDCFSTDSYFENAKFMINAKVFINEFDRAIKSDLI